MQKTRQQVLIDQISLLRQASYVKRCHQHPTLRDYTVGQHTFNVLALLRAFRPHARPELIWATLEHDAPERHTGDLAWPFKRRLGEQAAEELIAMERAILDRYSLNHYVGSLTQDEAHLLACLDMLEFCLWCCDEFWLGNGHITRMMNKSMLILINDMDPPEDILEFTRRLLSNTQMIVQRMEMNEW